MPNTKKFPVNQSPKLLHSTSTELQILNIKYFSKSSL